MVLVFRQQQCDYSASTRLMKSLWDLALAGHCCQTAQKNQVPLCSSQCLTFAHVSEMPYVVVAAPPSVCRDKNRAARAFLNNFCVGSIPEVVAIMPYSPTAPPLPSFKAVYSPIHFLSFHLHKVLGRGLQGAFQLLHLGLTHSP